MKKIVISFAILFIFLIYSMGIRHQAPSLKKPASRAGGATSSSGSGSGSSSNKSYKDGSYTGSVADAYYGNVQVSVKIVNSKITAVKFLQYPNTHSTSVYINQQVMPYLQQEAVQAQNSNVQIISGATYTSQAFIQ